MKVSVFSATRYDREFLDAANARHGFDLTYFEAPLAPDTALLAAGAPVCIFVNDRADAATLQALRAGGTRLVALRCTGFNNVDLAAAAALDIKVARVASYSPYSVAEHGVALIMALNRKIHRAYNRTREGNFALEGLMGFDLHGKTVDVVGTGKIGTVFAGIMKGFGCELVGYDVYHNPAFEALGGRYQDLGQLGVGADIISLHCPLTPESYRIVNASLLSRVKPGALLINTSRGGLVHTEAAIEALKSGRLGGMGIDVYEQEADVFFRDLSSEVIHDDVLARLMSFPNVIITGHQAFFTREATATISETTLANIAEFQKGLVLTNEVRVP
ncbi:MAG: 2-hydroxyacid dehydrogenase [Burkholderiales bacterium]